MSTLTVTRSDVSLLNQLIISYWYYLMLWPLSWWSIVSVSLWLSSMKCHHDNNKLSKKESLEMRFKRRRKWEKENSNSEKFLSPVWLGKLNCQQLNFIQLRDVMMRMTFGQSERKERGKALGEWKESTKKEKSSVENNNWIHEKDWEWLWCLEVETFDNVQELAHEWNSKRMKHYYGYSGFEQLFSSLLSLYR